MSNDTMVSASERLSTYNRDVIRAAAKAAGVVNVSYKSKAENIAEMVALKVIDIADGEPVFDFSVVTEMATSEAAARADRLERLERVLTEGQGLGLDDLDTDDDEPGVTYRLAMDGNGNSTLTLVVDDEMHTVPSSSVNYPRLVTALLAKEDPRPFLGDGIEAVLNWVTNNVSSRVTAEHARDEIGEAHAKVLIDDVEVHGKVIEQFKRYFLEGREPQNIVRFLEKVAENPLDVAEVGLYNWGSALTINEVGNFVGFKAVKVVRGEDGEIVGYTPSRSGPGAVNGVEPEDRRLIMNVGDTVTIDRSLVRPGPECGTGLHVGTWEYARGFLSDGVVMEVEVDPADIVNVPDYETGKLRCVEFKVLGFHDANGVLAHHEPEATWDEETAVESVIDVFEDEQAKGWFRRLFDRR